MMCKDIGVCRGDCQLRIPWHLWSSGWALLDVVRGLVNKVYLPPLLLAHRVSCNNERYRSRIVNGAPDGWGLLKLRVRRRNPLDGSEPSRSTRARDKVTQRVASSWCIRLTIEGTWHSQASYLSPE
jgi:hypothetical protein